MSLRAQVGISEGEDAYTVGANACQDAMSKLGESNADLVIVFSSVEYDQEKMLAGVRSVSKEALLVGSSTAGEITTDGPASRHSVAVMLLKSEKVKFYAAVGEGIAKSPRDAGKRVAEEVQKLA